MATRYKVLGQVAPSATTVTSLYTVPALTDVVVSSLVVANRGTAAATYDIMVRPAGETLANKHYLAKGVLLPSADSTTITIGMTLAPTDVVSVYAETADFSFSLFGSTIDV
jgi:hypothetical protein